MLIPKQVKILFRFQHSEKVGAVFFYYFACTYQWARRRLCFSTEGYLTVVSSTRSLALGGQLGSFPGRCGYGVWQGKGGQIGTRAAVFCLLNCVVPVIFYLLLIPCSVPCGVSPCGGNHVRGSLGCDGLRLKVMATDLGGDNAPFFTTGVGSSVSTSETEAVTDLLKSSSLYLFPRARALRHNGITRAARESEEKLRKRWFFGVLWILTSAAALYLPRGRYPIMLLYVLLSLATMTDEGIPSHIAFGVWDRKRDSL